VEADALGSMDPCGIAWVRGTSHCVYKTPWPGDPGVNIQESKGGKGTDYQVHQVLRAIDKMREVGDVD
jgi:hypothetical protein